MANQVTADEYLDTLTISKNTRRAYRTAINRFLKWSRENGYYTVGTAARNYEQVLLRDDRITRKTAETYSGIIRSFAKWVADSRNVSRRGETTVHAESECGPFLPLRIADEDLAYICNAAALRGESGQRGRAMLLLSLVCGMTTRQISHLMPDDVTFSAEGLWVRIRETPDATTSEFKAARVVEEALREYLISRGPVRAGLPLVAVTTKKTNRAPMPSEDVRKCIASMLAFLGYDYCDVVHGDLERTIGTYVPRLSAKSKVDVARMAVIRYYDERASLLGEGGR